MSLDKIVAVFVLVVLISAGVGALIHAAIVWRERFSWWWHHLALVLGLPGPLVIAVWYTVQFWQGI